MSEYTVIELPVEQAVEFFPGVAPYVMRGLEHDPYGRTAIHDIYQQITEGYAKVIAIHDEHELKGAAVAQLYKQPSDGVVVLHVCSLAGEDMEHWLNELLQVLEFMAAELNCGAVTMIGRKGWQRKLRGHGYDLDAVSMRKVIENERREDTAA